MSSAPATATDFKAAKPVRFKAPFVEPGMYVHWIATPDQTGPGVAALVTEVGDDGLALMLFPPMTNGGMVKSGVRHMDDPLLRTSEWAGKPGVWKHLRSNLAMIELMAEMSGKPAGK